MLKRLLLLLKVTSFLSVARGTKFTRLKESITDLSHQVISGRALSHGPFYYDDDRDDEYEHPADYYNCDRFDYKLCNRQFLANFEDNLANFEDNVVFKDCQQVTKDLRSWQTCMRSACDDYSREECEWLVEMFYSYIGSTSNCPDAGSEFKICWTNAEIFGLAYAVLISVSVLIILGTLCYTSWCNGTSEVKFGLTFAACAMFVSIFFPVVGTIIFVACYAGGRCPGLEPRGQPVQFQQQQVQVPAPKQQQMQVPAQNQQQVQVATVQPIQATVVVESDAKDTTSVA